LLAIHGEVGGRERVKRARAKPSQCVHVSQILKLRKSWNSGGTWWCSGFKSKKN